MISKLLCGLGIHSWGRCETECRYRLDKCRVCKRCGHRERYGTIDTYPWKSNIKTDCVE